MVMNLSSVFGQGALLRRIGIQNGEAFMTSCVEHGLVRRGPPPLTDAQVDELIREGKNKIVLERYYSRKAQGQPQAQPSSAPA